MNTGTLIMHALTAASTPRQGSLGSLKSLLMARLRTRRDPAQTRADEAAVVREMAARVRVSDPGFASDLAAAADRHEAIGDTRARG